jgi:hypothetical protein
MLMRLLMQALARGRQQLLSGPMMGALLADVLGGIPTGLMP